MAKLGARECTNLEHEVAALQRLGPVNPHATQLLAVHSDVSWPRKSADKRARCGGVRACGRMTVVERGGPRARDLATADQCPFQVY